MTAFVPTSAFLPKTESSRHSSFLGACTTSGISQKALSNTFKDKPLPRPGQSQSQTTVAKLAEALEKVPFIGGKSSPPRTSERRVSSLRTRSAPLAFQSEKGVKPGIPDDRKFYNSTSSRYYYRRATMKQGYTSFDVRVGERGAKSENSRVNDQGTFRNMDLYTEPLVWSCQGWTPAEAGIAVRTVYRNILGNPHLFESDLEQLRYSESCVRGNGNVKEFVRAVGLSEIYRKRFFESCSNLRFVELNFKHFLGRAPRSQEEVSKHIQIVANEGYNAEINSYIDSEEYDSLWGLSRVPDVNFRGGHPTDQEMNKLAIVNGTPCGSDSMIKTSYFSIGASGVQVSWSSVYRGLPASWKGENAGRVAAGLEMTYSLDKFWNVLPFGIKDEVREWTARYGTWNKFYYKDSVVFKNIVTPKLSVSDEEAAEAEAYLKYGSLMSKKYVGVRKLFNYAPVIEIKPPSGDGTGGFLTLSMKEIATSLPAELVQKV